MLRRSHAYLDKVTRFTTLPQTLYRVQAKLPTKLRDYDTQMALKRTSYDLKLRDGHMVMPSEGETFTGPNGMSLRPDGDNMRRILAGFKGSPTVFTLPVGLQLPPTLVVLHEHTDHWSMQARVPMPFADFNHELTKLLEAAPKQTREEFIAAADDEDNQDN